MTKPTKKEIGYYYRGGYRPRAVLSALGDVTGDEIAHVVTGAAFVIGVTDSIEFCGDRTNAQLTCEDRYHWLGGAALRETQEYDGRRLRDVAKNAIRAAGFKPVKL